ncbi:MAG: FtsB family cell division protein [bacterium]
MPHVAARRLELPPRASRRLVPRWAGSLIAVAVCAALVLAFGGAYWDGYQLRRDAARLARERDDLRRENAQLREEIRLLSTPEYIERLAREQLGLVRPGEIAVILVRPTPAPAPPAAPGTRDAGQREVREPKPWWVRLLGR